jgi:hypothetical protein
MDCIFPVQERDSFTKTMWISATVKSRPGIHHSVLVNRGDHRNVVLVLCEGVLMFAPIQSLLNTQCAFMKASLTPMMRQAK